MKKLYFLIFILSACHVLGQAPGSVKGYTTWLKGDFKADHPEITTIPGSSNQSLKSYPGISLLNFNHSLEFDGKNNQVFLPLQLDDLGRITIFVVYQDLNPGPERTIWKLNGSTEAIELTTQKVRGFEDSMEYMNVLPSPTLINTYMRRWKASSGDNIDNPGLVIGINEGRAESFRGKIAEYILYNRALKLSERRKIESSLAVKYGITLKNNYISSTGKITWPAKTNSDFSYRITGICRDDAAGLYQKQSTSCDQTFFMAISAGRIAMTNNENPAKINDQDFLLFGDNNGDLKLDRPDVITKKFPLLERKWLMEVSGVSAYTLSTELKVDANILSLDHLPADKYLLVIDPDSKGRFSPENTRFITADEISPEGIITFRNIQWDTDRSGKDIFTFTLKPNLDAHLVAASQLSSDRIILYPNPSPDGLFNLEIILEKAATVVVKIYDESNRLIRTLADNNQDHYRFVDRIRGSAGVYTLLIHTANKTITRRLVVR